MSVVRGRPPGLAGGIIGAGRAYCSSPRACPAPKSPTSARLSAVHMACLREGLLPSRTADATAPPHARLDGASFSNGLLKPLPSQFINTVEPPPIPCWQLNSWKLVIGCWHMSVAYAVFKQLV